MLYLNLNFSLGRMCTIKGLALGSYKNNNLVSYNARSRVMPIIAAANPH